MEKKAPVYKTIYQEIKQRITKGEYEKGSLLPTEMEFIREFSVSRATIRKALEMLSNDGFVLSTPGRGTEVLTNSASQNLNTVTSLSETLRSRGYEVRSKSIYIDRIPADRKLADELSRPEGSLVVRIQRVTLADDVPIAIMKNYIPSELVPDIENVMTIEKSLYLCLEMDYGIVIDKSYDRITARVATFTDAEILNIDMGEALIAFARICHSSGVPICVDHVSIVGKRYEFGLTLNGRNKYC